MEIMSRIFTILFVIAGTAFYILMFIVVFKVVRDTWRGYGRWGINFHYPYKCPQCDNKLPIIRIPNDFQEGMWGGWTCKRCGCKVDKWGGRR
jgi:hypothetical protein